MKAQGFLAQAGIAVRETASVSKQFGRDDALRLARAASTIIVAKGSNVVRFDMKKEPPDEATLLSHLLGPTGNLRAPTVVTGTRSSVQ